MTAEALYKTEQMAVMIANLPEGNCLPRHRHDQTEWILCFGGKVKFTSDDYTQILTVGSCLKLEPGESHQSLALEDSQTLVVTIPADPGFPDVR